MSRRDNTHPLHTSAILYYNPGSDFGEKSSEVARCGGEREGGGKGVIACETDRKKVREKGKAGIGMKMEGEGGMGLSGRLALRIKVL